jgi:GNAT superfamily N-acetyltransferase
MGKLEIQRYSQQMVTCAAFVHDAGLAIQVECAGWDDAPAVALRGAMSAEMGLLYADRIAARAEPPPGPGAEAASIAWTGVAYAAGRVPVGHAALRRLDADLELKRMYVAPTHRSAGVGSALLAAAERAAARLGAGRIVLQTGDRQPDAVRRYEKCGYTRIPIFGPYRAMPHSRCFQKLLPAPGGEV